MRLVNHARTFIYEWKGKYIVAEWGYQNGYTNDTLGDSPYAHEEIGVVALFPVDGCQPDALGGAVLKALVVFGTRPSKYPAWEIQERNREFAKSVGARGRASFERDCRRADVVFDSLADPPGIVVRP